MLSAVCDTAPFQRHPPSSGPWHAGSERRSRRRTEQEMAATRTRVASPRTLGLAAGVTVIVSRDLVYLMLLELTSMEPGFLLDRETLDEVAVNMSGSRQSLHWLLPPAQTSLRPREVSLGDPMNLPQV